ncbi:uncharacterized protein LOC132279657 [Cornus florida]|uniref:uncharacterized protein LOC132279657 n=1 Tax=Cornus florida TaxID=4283 RepID=UPI0028A0EF9C|nr:uncharacterized protein LOC132279657 [Cornus florida]
MAAQDTYEDPIYNWDEDIDLKQIMGKLVSLPQKLGEGGKYPLEPIDTDEPVGFFEVDPEKDHVWKRTKDDRSTAVGLCPICLDVMSTDTMDIIYETCCLHVFHRRCISAWLSESNSCPTCRFQVLEMNWWTTIHLKLESC